jgi:replicative DNA helicase
MLTPYDKECYVLASVIKYGKQAAQVVLPYLTPDKFVFDLNGSFGLAHYVIWEAVVSLYNDQQAPVYALVVQHLPEYQTYLESLLYRLTNQYHVTELDESVLLGMAEKIDVGGIVHQVASRGMKYAKVLEDPQEFAYVVNNIQDIDKWNAENVEVFQTATSFNKGYTEVGSIVDLLKDRWTAVRNGVNVSLLNCGIPILMSNKLFPRGKMAVVHGLSGSGKSSFCFQYALGVAMGLVQNKIPGCVAINSLEMTQQDLIEACVATLAKVDVSKLIDGSLSEEEYDRLMLWSDVVARLPIYVDESSLTTSAMQYRSSGLHVSHGPVVLLVSDYGELFEDEDTSEEQRVNKIFRSQFRLSRMINASVLAISQSTPNAGSTVKHSHIAGPDGTRYSRGVLQATDVLAEMYNPPAIASTGRQVFPPEGFSKDLAYLIIQKYRGAKTGGSVPLGWKPEFTSFWDVNLQQTPGDETFFTHVEETLLALGLRPEDYGYQNTQGVF